MPDVEIKCRADWYPGELRIQVSPKRELTVAIAQKLPDLIRAAYRDICDVSLTPGQTIFDFTSYHGQASINQPDISVTVEASLSEKVNGGNVGEIRDHILNAIKDYILLDLGITPGSEVYPKLDVVVRLAIEAGVAVGKDGKVLDEW